MHFETKKVSENTYKWQCLRNTSSAVVRGFHNKSGLDLFLLLPPHSSYKALSRWYHIIQSTQCNLTSFRFQKDFQNIWSTLMVNHATLFFIWKRWQRSIFLLPQEMMIPLKGPFRSSPKKELGQFAILAFVAAHGTALFFGHIFSFSLWSRHVLTVNGNEHHSISIVI